MNVSNPKTSLPFYKDLLGYFGYKVINKSEEHIEMSNGTTDFWILATDSEYKKNTFHRKNTGINHLAFKVTKKEDVDLFVKEFLQPRKINTLYQTPKLFPEYKEGYYAVFFEDPDRIKLEIVHAPKSLLRKKTKRKHQA